MKLHKQAKKKGEISHSLRGVWVEMSGETIDFDTEVSHSLRGVWVEIRETYNHNVSHEVTPFGECGLKFISSLIIVIAGASLPSGSVG